MKKIILGIGIPGSGKTTVLKRFAEKNGYAYISPDEIRKELTGSELDQSKNREVWDEVYRRSKNIIENGEILIVDATFAKLHERKDFLAFARKAGADKVQGIFVDAPFEVAKERNEMRDRKIPDYAMERINDYIKSFPPEIEDGFDALFTIDENAELVRVDTDKGEFVMQKEFRSESDQDGEISKEFKIR